MNTKLILAGGSGFLGAVLAEYFTARGMEIIILTRRPKQRADTTREVRWEIGRLVIGSGNSMAPGR